MDALEFIDIIVPDHERTSCSDSDPNNGLYSRNFETWHGRCRRCIYLDILREGKAPEGYNSSEAEG